MVLLDISNRCPLTCAYCYSRHEVPKLKEQDFFAAILRLAPNNRHLCFHGKEPLVELELLDKTARFVRKNIPSAVLSVQTNGLFLEGRAVEILVEHNVQVGVSLDGPWPLNRLRADEYTTRKITENVVRFAKESGQSPGVITVLTTVNAPEIKRMLDWTDELKAHQICTYRFNPVLLCHDLEPQCSDLISFYSAMIEHGVSFMPWDDLFKPHGERSCSFRGCDPDASAIPIILPNGEVTSCLKTPPVFSWSQPVGVRSGLLQELTQDEGGCRGCKWWTLCLGGCPFEGEDNLLRSRYCGVWRFLFAEALRVSPSNPNVSPCQAGARGP